MQAGTCTQVPDRWGWLDGILSTVHSPSHTLCRVCLGPVEGCRLLTDPPRGHVFADCQLEEAFVSSLRGTECAVQSLGLCGSHLLRLESVVATLLSHFIPSSLWRGKTYHQVKWNILEGPSLPRIWKMFRAQDVSTGTSNSTCTKRKLSPLLGRTALHCACFNGYIWLPKLTGPTGSPSKSESDPLPSLLGHWPTSVPNPLD